MRLRMVWVLIAAAAATTASAQQGQGGGNAQGGGRGITAQRPANGGGAQQQAGAQQGGTGSGGEISVGPTSNAFDRACVDLLDGRMPKGENAIKTLNDACGKLMSGRANERIDAERKIKQEQEEQQAQAQAQLQAGRASAQPQQGQGVLAAFQQAGSELAGGGRRMPLGMRRGGPVSYMLVTNPVGWFSGLGVNAELFGVFNDAPKFSWVVGARYAATDATNGTASTFGAELGADYFILGQHDEGLRLGPRVEVAAGREHFISNTSFARMGLGGELGYNFIASNGISGLAAIGVGGRLAGNSKNDNFSSFVGGEFGPYAKIGIGFGW